MPYEKKLKVKAVLFDNDGALIDSSRKAVARHKRLAKKLGLPVPTQKQIKAIWGMRWEHDVAPFLWPKDHQSFCREYLKTYYRVTYSPFPGLINLLKKLQQQKIIMGVITSRDKESFTRRLKQSGISTKLFSFIQTMDDIPYHKPDPRTFLPVWYKLRQRGIKKSEVVYLGDTLMDSYAARDFGLTFIAVLTGPHSKKDFLAAGVPAHLILKTPSELPSIIT